jgi:sarcosine/dimethylglycine N-methyltransferase
LASSIDELYGDLWGRSASGLSEDVGRSLSPRSADWLYEAFAGCGVGPEDMVLDAGSRDAGHAIELAKRFGCRCVALDPVSLHREYMQKAIAEADLSDRVTAVQGDIGALPFTDASVDAIWCRDVLNHVDLPRGLAECLRVLKPGGSMLIYVTLATEQCEPREAARLWEALAIIPANMERGYFERCARAAGFEITMADRINSEWREHAIESGDRWGELKALLQLARMRRREANLVERHGRNAYEAAYAGELWGIYQLLGKLCPMVYRLQKQSS